MVELSGPTTVQPAGGASYTVLIEDDLSRLGWNSFLACKSDAAIVMRRFLANVRDQGLSSIVECAGSNNGGERLGRAFNELCEERGIRQEWTPQLNAVVERGLAFGKEAA